MCLAVAALVASGVLSACGADRPSDATSASDAAHRVGCEDETPVEVPSDWQDYDEAVGCELAGATVVIVWKEATAGAGNTAIICEPGTQPACEAAMKAFLPKNSGA